MLGDDMPHIRPSSEPSMTPDASKPAAKTETKKPAKKEINKSAEIRKVASGMKAKGEKPRPVVIIETLV